MSTKYIHNVKDDPVLQVSGQELSTSSKYLHSWPPILDTLLIQISTQNFQGIFVRVKQDHPWHQGWPCPPNLWSGTLNVLQVPPFMTPILDTQNYQGIFLGFKGDHPWHQGWPCPPSLMSGIIKVLQVPPFLTPHSWHPSNEDINMKLLGYLPLGHTRSSMT